MSHITSLLSQNVKCLKAIRISPKGAMTVVSGRNGEGKSSVLDSILYAFGGKDAFPEKPVREGEERADIEVVLDSGLVVKRYVTTAGTSGISVFAKDGAKYPSPQKVLDELTGKLTFDPLAFLKLEPLAQAATLRKLVGLDTAVTDAEYAKVFAERTIVNRRLTEMRAAVTQMPTHADAPSAEVSSADILAAIEKAQTHNQQGITLDMMVTTTQRGMAAANEAYDRAYATVKDLETKLAAAKTALITTEAGQVTAQKAVETAAAARKAFTPQDTTALKAQLQSCEQTNAKVRANAQRAKAVAEGQAKKAEADILTARLEKLESDKAAALAAVRFPVEGLALNGDTLTFNGIPLKQVNTAQQIRVGVAISAALSPKLKVILVRNGNDLDATNLAALADMAQEMGLQCWVEKIEGGVGAVQIEDGEVVGAEPVKPEPKKRSKPMPAQETPKTDAPQASATPAGVIDCGF